LDLPASQPRAMSAAAEASIHPLRGLQMAVLPEEVLMAAESQWLFTEEELLRTPSILDGLSPEKERENRGKGVNFILQVGIMLKLPQTTLAAASVFLHRFYMRHSMQDVPGRQGHHYYSMAATSLFLATKVEENCRKMKELVIACVRVAQKDPYKTVDEQDKDYWRWRDNILLNEDLLLEAICFDLQLEPPYKTLYDLLVHFGEQNNKKLRNAAWAFISDSCVTTLCLLCSSRTIATSALYTAARYSGVAFSDDKVGRPWWQVIGASLDDIVRACNYMADVYQMTPAKAERENALYERTPRVLDERQDKTRLVENRRGSYAEIESELPYRLERESDLGVQAEVSAHANGNDYGVVDANTVSGADDNVPSRPLKRKRPSKGGPEATTGEIAGCSQLNTDKFQKTDIPTQF
ncbi:MAG: hypothetical protein Q9163_006527, partial [Psora crenata]